MENVISFAAWKNDKRAEAEQARRDEARSSRIETKVDALAEAVDKLFGLPLNRDVAREAIGREQAAKAPAFMPAYCDPTNEVRGAKHDATRDLTRTEIAKRMRADIKALALGAGFKVSVTCQSYSGGGSIDIRVTAVPSGFTYYTPAAASWLKQFPGREHRMPINWQDALSPQWRELRGKLGAVHASYNRNNSDSMSDYFDTRFNGGVDMDWRLADQLRKADVAAAPTDYWADDCA